MRALDDRAIANELVGVAQDELTDRYRYPDEEEIVPLVVNSRQISENQAELIFNDGRKARITVEILPRNEPAE